ncbi:MAG: HU family DNA-binding protein [Alphaproteobacteria bacterium]|nr:MAG: HU family DNA-binding protein [Alphaproteobacteria bacterium]
MNKADLVALVASQTNMTKADAERAVEAVFGGIGESLRKGAEARFTNFGTFSVRTRAAREGRNPRTGEKIKIPASKQPVFRAGKELKEICN